MITYLKVIRYPKLSSGGWSTTPEEVTDAYDVDVSLSIGDLNDTFNFNIPNTNNSRITGFEKEDKINIHLLANTETYNDTNLIFTGLIKNISETVSKDKTLSIEGVSLGEVLTTGLVNANNTNVDVMQHLQSCLASIANYAPNFTVTWDNNNPILKKDDITAFPKLSGGGLIADRDSSYNTVINKYLTDQYMQDGQYYWYVDINNKLVIRPRLDNPTNSITEGVDILNAKYSLDPQIYNYVIVKCGTDSQGSQITTRAVDYTSMAKYGFKYYFLVNNNIASDLFKADNVEQGSYPTSYPHTCAWKDESGSTVTATGDSDYRSKFRAQVKVLGSNYGLEWINLNSSLKKKFTLVLMPTKAYTVGGVVTIIAPSYNINNKNMRISDIQYSQSNTILTLKEDVNL